MAQNYKGIVVDNNNEPLPFANIVMMSLPDSAFICGTVSDIDGNFAIECGKKADILKISSVGYETLFMDKPVDNLGAVRLQLSDTQIEEVVVKAQKPKTKLTGNSMVTSIQGSVLEESGSLKEMLGKVPGLTEGSNGVEVIGKGAPVYYINGRKLQDLDELKRINSKDIQEVEVIQNPGAEYDATVSAVVRIKTVRREGTGFGFDVDVNNNQDIEYSHSNPSATVNLRYRKNALDLFGMMNYWSWDAVSDNQPDQDTYFKSKGDINSVHQSSAFVNNWHGYGLNYNLGFNYQIGEKHFIGARVDGHSKLDGGTDLEQETFIKKYNGVVEHALASEQHSISKQNDKEDEPYNWDGNLYYNGSYGKLGVDLNVDFLTKKVSETNTIDENNDGVRTQMLVEAPNTTKMIADKLVLSYPVWKGQVKAGTEMSFVDRKSSYQMSTALLPTTNSDVKERNLAAFVEYGFQLEKIGQLSVGLRYEHVGFDYNDLLDSKKSMTRFTDDVFPTFSWANQFGSWQASLSYSVKTRRPSYWQLSETLNYLNPYSIEGGNPTLKNERDQKIDFSLRYKVATFFAGYSSDRDAITEWSYIYNDNEDGIILMKSINLEDPVRHFEVGVNASPTFGCYNPNWTSGFMKYNYKQTLADPRESTGSREIKLGKPMWFFNINNAFRLPKNWVLEANYNGNSKGDWQNFSITNFSGAFNFVVQKSWLKNNALCLRVTLQDAFKTSGQNVFLDCGYYTLSQHQHNNRQRLNVSLRYTFNAQQSKYKGTGAGDDAKSRMDK